MESAYTAVYLWKAMVEEAGSFDVPVIQEVAGGTTITSPEGTVTVDGEKGIIYEGANLPRDIMTIAVK